MMALSACDTLDELLGAQSRQQQPLVGERVSVMSFHNELEPDPIVSKQKVRMMQPQLNSDFAHETSLQQAGLENILVKGFNEVNRTTIGDGNKWETKLVQQPVIGDGALFAMDAHGVVSAHDLLDIDRIMWEVDTNFRDDEREVPGGGLAYAHGVVYVTSGYGSVMAIVAKDGSLLWRQEANIPIRSAPAISENNVFVVTIDNQLLAYDARTGRPSWSHRGIRESAVYLGTVMPVVENGIVVAAYSSGELFAIRIEDGSPIWSDTLIANKRTSASAVVTGINATPVIRDGIVYAISNSGLMAANFLVNGRGVWDVELSGYHTPWIAGEYIFVLTADSKLMAIHRHEKVIKWITSLVSEDVDEDDETLQLTSPVMVNNRLLLISEAGEMLLFSPDSGELLERVDIPDDIRVAPIFAGGAMYLLRDDATLYQYQ